MLIFVSLPDGIGKWQMVARGEDTAMSRVAVRQPLYRFGHPRPVSPVERTTRRDVAKGTYAWLHRDMDRGSLSSPPASVFLVWHPKAQRLSRMTSTM